MLEAKKNKQEKIEFLTNAFIFVNKFGFFIKMHAKITHKGNINIKLLYISTIEIINKSYRPFQIFKQDDIYVFFSFPV